MLPILGVFFGIVTLAMAGFIFKEGKVNVTRSYAVYGKPAYVIGTLLILYLPVSIAILYGLRSADIGLVAPGNKDLVFAAVVQVCLGVLLVFLVFAGIIALIFAESDAAIWRPRKRPPQNERRSRGRQMREDEIEEMEEERQRRRQSRRQSARDDDEDDEFERRPRRRRD